MNAAWKQNQDVTRMYLGGVRGHGPPMATSILWMIILPNGHTLINLKRGGWVGRRFGVSNVSPAAGSPPPIQDFAYAPEMFRLRPEPRLRPRPRHNLL